LNDISSTTAAPSANDTAASPDFESVLAARLSRRSLLKGSFATAAASYLGGSLNLSASSDVQAAARTLRLNFQAIPKSVDDKIVIANGYQWQVLLATGDPLTTDVPAYANDGSDEAGSFSHRAGDHHDGMHFFGMDKSGRWDAQRAERGLLCLNHEAVTAAFLHPLGETVADGKRISEDEVMKEMLAHGVSIVEVRRHQGSYVTQQDSALNRRITPFTDMELTGPAARSPQLITKYSITGTRTRGTIANCANGHTPWGTYLTCEENWAGFFKRGESDNAKRSAKELTALRRYGVEGKGKHLWASVQPDTADQRFGRWHAAVTGTSANGSDDFRNVANTFGWVVEIDPFAREASPKKRTALGRFAHEGAWPGPVIPGQPLVWYMGCDARNEYIYKYVSNAVWDPNDAKRGIAAGDKYLNDGKLYAARFNADGSGDWLELRFGLNNIDANYASYAFSDQADVLIHARLAADAAGATRMDRPEWGAVNPKNGEVYMTLTYNPSRALDQIDAANPRAYNDTHAGDSGKSKGKGNGKGNVNGHIIRWAEQEGRVAATQFQWDVFLFAARSSADPQHVNLSALTADNDFSSPDGLWFARSGLLWIETDDHAYRDASNCMLLAAIPGKVGDGATRTITNREEDKERTMTTHVGKPAEAASLRRFLVGPVDCEITGLTESPDGKALFINVQHPGETTNGKEFNIADQASYLSHWPDGGKARPRSATIVITRKDGGLIGADLV
jgi:secreted PhoX family phosphatase